jgi:hypothetical protein
MKRKKVPHRSTLASETSDRLYPGCLVKVNPGPDHGAQARINAGKIGIVIRHMTERDGVSSSPNVWQVLIDGKHMNFHALDLTPMTDE